MRIRRTLLGIAGAALLATLSLPATSARADEHDDIVQKIESAKTPADHDALAAHYTKMAADAKKQADRHRRMAKTYGAGPSAGKGTWAAFPQHCTNLAKDLDSEATEYEAMAAAHRELAKTAAK
jgi:hypothetical protein